MTNTKSFSAFQIRSFVKGCQHDFGSSWDKVGPVFQRALLTQTAFHVLSSQNQGSVSTETMNELLEAMLTEAGVDFA